MGGGDREEVADCGCGYEASDDVLPGPQRARRPGVCCDLEQRDAAVGRHDAGRNGNDAEEDPGVCEVVNDRSRTWAALTPPDMHTEAPTRLLPVTQCILLTVATVSILTSMRAP